MSSSSSSNGNRFQCILTNDPENQSSEVHVESCLYFDPEEGKKSSHLLKLHDDNDNGTAAVEIAKPAHLLLQTCDKNVFFFGGIEMMSNARNVEIYLTESSSSGMGGAEEELHHGNSNISKETYLTTSRGLLAQPGQEDNPNRFQILVVCPGGPRPVTRVHLKLLSLKPTSCTSASLDSMKLKGRLLPPLSSNTPSSGQLPLSSSSTNNTASSNTKNNATNIPQGRDNSTPPLTQADVGHAMAGISLLVRSVETSLIQSMQSSMDRLEQKMDARLNRIEQFMLLHQQQQQAALQQQQQQYQEQLEQLRKEMMQQAKDQQSEMVELIESLRSQIAAFGRRNTNDGNLETGSTQYDADHDDAVCNNEQMAEEISASGNSACELKDEKDCSASIQAATATLVGEDSNTQGGDDEEESTMVECTRREQEDIVNDSGVVEDSEPTLSIESQGEGGCSEHEETEPVRGDDAQLGSESGDEGSTAGSDDGPSHQDVAVRAASKCSVNDDKSEEERAVPNDEDTCTSERSPTASDDKAAYVSDESSEPAFHAPEATCVMSRRDDAIDIPDLLSDTFPVNELAVNSCSPDTDGTHQLCDGRNES